MVRLEARRSPAPVPVDFSVGSPTLEFTAGDVHYLREEDHHHHTALLCVQTKSTLANPKMVFDTNEFFLKDNEQMTVAFSEWPEAIASTVEIAERNRIAAKERKQQLQYLFIGIFIPGFFLLTLLLSRIRIHPRIIKVLGILSLLILFEYLLLLLHPTVAELTHHTPVLEMLIFVSIAAILIPAHHRIEGWLIKKLIHRNESIRFRKVKFVSKKPKQ